MEDLEAVKTEFGKFTDQLEKVDDRLGKAKSELEKLRNTRTNVMERKLRDVGTMELARRAAACWPCPEVTPRRIRRATQEEVE